MTLLRMLASDNAFSHPCKPVTRTDRARRKSAGSFIGR